MRRQFVIWLLLLSNLVLLGTVIWQARLGYKQNPKSSTKLQHRAALPPSSSNPGMRVTSVSTEVRSERSLPVATEPANNSETNWPRFDWRRVESEDYRTYIKNLRDLGCPEQTLRDIVSADLLQVFSAKREEAAKAAYQDFKFWEFDEAGRAEFARQRHDVDTAMTEALRDLVGTDVAAASVTAQWTSAELNQALAFLPPDKRVEVNSVLADYDNADVELPHPINRNRLTQDQAEELQRRLEKFDAKETELRNLLTPGEYERMELSISSTADNLRRGMQKFHPSEEEFRAIFPIWRAHDERIARLWAAGEPDPGNDYVFSAIEKVLNEERFAEYRETWWK